ncbi:transcriptional regulator with XRE-family HTH domain [Duganella sp. 1224]|uniref:helix-turn-helix domain-containing protein n=1 Tax=Duganella sp. 1224 TaxID=2587052 RepID=UPI0015CBD9C8|nr:helix-turn-helix transcriptional regulator [Duganella sp. 1224]NYE62468.1 transcriptional regulator with XRE-family HTH domain [Duganella sp. 1224]
MLTASQNSRNRGNFLDTLATAFGEVLRTARIEAGLTQEQLGLTAGIQRKYVSELELGKKTPSLDTVVKIAGALGLQPGELVTLAMSALHRADK